MLDKKKKQALKAMGNSLKATVQVGKDGLSENIIDMAEKSLEAHELIKVSILKTCPVSTNEISLDISANTHAEIVQIIGRTILLYRASEKRKIHFE